MNIFLLFTFLFFLGSVSGWCLELFYRRFKKSNISRKWINPGFLIGPYLPIYGFGVCALYSLSMLDKAYVDISGGIHLLLVILVSGIAMTVIELIAGIIFINGFKVKLWDYDREPFNYKGIICLRFSVIWAFLGAFYYFAINPYIVNTILWFSKHLAFSFVVGMFFGAFIIDVSYSFNLISKMRAFAKEEGILVRFEDLKYRIREHVERKEMKYRFMFAFSTSVSIHDIIREQIQERKSQILEDFEMVKEIIEEKIKD